MGFRYRKSIKVAPGVKVNINKRGVSTTVGGKKTPHVTVNSNGQVTVSSNLPVKGLSYRSTTSLASTKYNVTPACGVVEYETENSSVDNNHKIVKLLSFVAAVVICIFICSAVISSAELSFFGMICLLTSVPFIGVNYLIIKNICVAICELIKCSQASDKK